MNISTWTKVQVERIDGRRWINLRPLIITTRDGKQWEVPTGFITDFASSKIGRWNTLPDHAAYSEAAVFHDYLYARNLVDKQQADLYFYEMLQDDRNSDWICRKAYWGVRAFGWVAWNKHRRNDHVRKETEDTTPDTR